MAVNDSRSMNADFHQGGIDNTYIQLTPNRGNPENPPIERFSQPQYRQAEQHSESPFYESALRRTTLPVENKARYGSDQRLY